jgi:hypothetical protein
LRSSSFSLVTFVLELIPGLHGFQHEVKSVLLISFRCSIDFWRTEHDYDAPLLIVRCWKYWTLHLLRDPQKRDQDLFAKMLTHSDILFLFRIALDSFIRLEVFPQILRNSRIMKNPNYLDSIFWTWIDLESFSRRANISQPALIFFIYPRTLPYRRSGRRSGRGARWRATSLRTRQRTQWNFSRGLLYEMKGKMCE